MKIGVVYPQIELAGDPSAVGRFGLAAEALGYDHLSAYDHVLGAAHADRDPPLTGPYTERDPFHDPLLMFAYLAGQTKRIEFASAVLVLPQRQTALVARQAADLDLLSGERLRLGVGTGWNPVEFQALHEDFANRGKRINEQIQVLRKLWSSPLLTFDGEFHQIDRAALNPLPRRQIPIWIGGFNEVAYRRAGALGDGHMFAGGFEQACDGWASIRRHLEAAGRPAEGFGLDLMIRGQAAAKTCETVERWRDFGGTHATVGTMGQGFRSVDQHVEFITEVARLLGR